MEAQAELYRFSGNVLVAVKGNVVYKRSFGFADQNTKKKLDSNSIFDCGSIAKEFTAVGILLLKDKGKISYSDTLRKFFPELPYCNITIQQLLTHTSGVPDGSEVVTQAFDHQKIATNEDLIRLLASEKPPVYFKPGEDLMYSGTGFNLLACIIEKVSGQSYNAYMDQQVFRPLGMTHTQVSNGYRSGKTIPGYAWGYVYSDSLKRYQRADSLETGWTSYLTGITGEGMIITTTGDLLKWDRALNAHSLLTETTQQEMLSLQAEKKTVPKVQFGYGIRVGRNEVGNYIFHNGWYPGFESMLMCYTDQDITAIVLSNDESHSEFIADALVAIVLNKTPAMPSVHKAISIAPASDKYFGKYLMALSRPPYMVTFPVDLARKNNKFYIHPMRGSDIELKPESETKFFFADGTDQQIEFETDPGGNLFKVWHTAWGIKKELKKVG